MNVAALAWMAAGLVGTWASWSTLQKLRRQRATPGEWRSPDGRLASAVVPRLGITPTTWETIAEHRDVARWWARTVTATIVGGFCALLAVSALWAIVTDLAGVG